MGDNFLSKSFLFEIVDSATEKIDESFTLILPPQSYTIKEKQRVNITKTFGNAFVDDYGPDNIELTIKGISGTSHAFPTFQTQGISNIDWYKFTNGAKEADRTSGFRHREAFYYFRDKIIRYKDNYEFDKKELRVYDLADQQAYKCVLLEFSVDRNADRPFTYPFTISLFVYARMGSKDVSSARTINIGKNPKNVLLSLYEAMNSFEKKFPLFKTIQKIKNQVAIITNQLNLLEAKYNSWLEKGKSILESPLALTKQVIDAFGVLAEAVYDTYNQGKMLVEDYVNAKENINNQIREICAMYGFAIQEGSQQTKVASISTFKSFDYVTDPLNPEPTYDDETFAFSGVITYTVLGGDTLQSIAQDYLGDDSLWIYIAAVNNDINSNEDLVVGQSIFIPVANDSITESKDSFILTEDTNRNPYGADIELDSSGNMVIQESNDVGIIDGVENVIQSVDIRLNTLVGSLLKQTAFGLMTNIGMAGTDYAISYIKMNFRNSLIQDPRISDVSNVAVTVLKDSFRISADITLIGLDLTLPVSTVL